MSKYSRILYLIIISLLIMLAAVFILESGFDMDNNWHTIPMRAIIYTGFAGYLLAYLPRGFNTLILPLYATLLTIFELFLWLT